MTILVTNDDGQTYGAEILLETAKKFDKNSFAIVPDRQQSAVSSALTLHKPLRLKQIREDIFTLNGTPADIVLFAINSGKFPKPSLVLSGINSGDNTCVDSLLSSGTLGACWQAVLYSVPAIAFSLYKSPENWGNRNPWKKQSELLKKYTEEILKLLIKKKEKDVFYNVTFPDNLSNSKIIFPKKLQRQRFKAIITERKDPYGVPYYWLSGNFKNIEKGADLYEVVVNKNITITSAHLRFWKD